MKPSNEPIRTFLLVSGDFVLTGGMDRGNYYLACYLAEQGHVVHLVTHRTDQTLLAYPNVILHRVARPVGVQLLGGLLLRWAGLRVAKRLASSGEVYSVVNGGNCPLPGANWVHYVHAAARPFGGGSLLRRWKNRLTHRLFLWEEAEAMRQATVVIANSQRTSEDLLRNYPSIRSKLRLVYYGMDAEAFHPVETGEKAARRAALGLPTDKWLVVFVGALGDQRKGFDTLFEAWQRVAATEFAAQAELIVIGTGAELPEWQRRAAESSLHGTIRFLGFRRDVVAVLQASDAFAAPTRYEAYGLAVAEAVCCGLPTIVSRDAGVSERLPASLAPLLLDDPDDPSELATKLHMLFARRQEFEEMTRAVAASFRKYSWAEMARTIHDEVLFSRPDDHS